MKVKLKLAWQYGCFLFYFYSLNILSCGRPNPQLSQAQPDCFDDVTNSVSMKLHQNTQENAQVLDKVQVQPKTKNEDKVPSKALKIGEGRVNSLYSLDKQ